MNRRLMLAMAIVVSAPAVLAQTRNTASKSVEAQIAALDRQGWEAWKRNDPTWFQKNTTEDFVSVSSDGMSTKAEVVKSTSIDCKVVSFSLEGVRFVWLDKNAVLLTYKATQDAVCGGKKAPTNLQVAANYVRRDGKWLEAMYMQAP